jgi:hypothetical protein
MLNSRADSGRKLLKRWRICVIRYLYRVHASFDGGTACPRAHSKLKHSTRDPDEHIVFA